MKTETPEKTNFWPVLVSELATTVSHSLSASLTEQPEKYKH